MLLVSGARTQNKSIRNDSKEDYITDTLQVDFNFFKGFVQRLEPFISS